MKKKLTFSKLVMIALLAIFPLSFYAQTTGNQGSETTTPNFKQTVDKYFYILGEGGAAIHHGDLAEYGFKPDFDYVKLNGQLGLGYQFGGVIGANAKLGIGQLAGQKTKLGKTMENSYLEGNLNITFNMMNLIFGYKSDRVFSFIPHVGVGQIQYKGEIFNLNADGTQGSSIGVFGQDGDNVIAEGLHDNGIGGRRVVLTVPVGAELNFNVCPKLDIFVDYTFNWVDSDLLDGEPYKKAKPIYEDMYTNVNLGLRYKFNNPCNLEKMANEAGQIQMKAVPDVLTEKDGKVDVTVEVTFPENYFEKNAVMNFTPVLTYANGSKQLEPITFVGEKVKGDGTTVNYKNGETYTYKTTVEYEESMEKSELKAAPMFYKYENTIYPTEEEIVKNTYYTQAADRKLADGVTVTTKPEVPVVVEPEPEPEPEPVVADFSFFFQKNSSNLKPNTDLNKAAVAALAAKLAAGESIKGFDIQGWASPEGELELNEDLAINRAKAAEKAIRKQLKKANINADQFEFTTTGYGPDWDNFLKEVENSNIADKDAILNVIRSANQAQKETEIKNMILIYPELEETIFPTLRRAEVFIK
jgi:OmpA family.